MGSEIKFIAVVYSCGFVFTAIPSFISSLRPTSDTDYCKNSELDRTIHGELALWVIIGVCFFVLFESNVMQ